MDAGGDLAVQLAQLRQRIASSPEVGMGREIVPSSGVRSRTPGVGRSAAGGGGGGGAEDPEVAAFLASGALDERAAQAIAELDV
eukprot:CAMPEP_0183473312 /NCGR_PEP_ID=MMETSP0370-20130417/161067_1 /TAXON_ID=268820 /ORGANISM="Peridinium aciculiferum, Strain PAER-2" /LENGTH=83 /DNA_ID=CAMNT_0025665995 /DNA_START=1 /DNA_END=249 /DNA_ORIENTATION=+